MHMRCPQRANPLASERSASASITAACFRSSPPALVRAQAQQLGPPERGKDLAGEGVALIDRPGVLLSGGERLCGDLNGGQGLLEGALRHAVSRGRRRSRLRRRGLRPR